MRPKMLASVRSLPEAKIALACGADIIDLKEPSAGALGAVSLETACAIVSEVNGRVPVSATVGDLRGEPAEVVRAIERMAQTGVDVVKVGFFERDRRATVLSRLAPLAAAGIRIVAVLFADRTQEHGVGDLGRSGLYGAMFDTAQKSAASLARFLTEAELRRFVADCRSHRLVSGLAGGLMVEDIAAMARIGPDYLGFRGALCDGNQREQNLSRRRIAAVRAALHSEFQSVEERLAAGGY